MIHTPQHPSCLLSDRRSNGSHQPRHGLPRRQIPMTRRAHGFLDVRYSGSGLEGDEGVAAVSQRLTRSPQSHTSDRL